MPGVAEAADALAVQAEFGTQEAGDAPRQTVGQLVQLEVRERPGVETTLRDLRVGGRRRALGVGGRGVGVGMGGCGWGRGCCGGRGALDRLGGGCGSGRRRRGEPRERGRLGTGGREDREGGRGRGPAGLDDGAGIRIGCGTAQGYGDGA
ncbi:hypothetical protein CP966_19090 [Streptomyces galilaeus]|nr:hypothetical protein CP966_19090 [Streptomyces galilaeus]